MTATIKVIAILAVLTAVLLGAADSARILVVVPIMARSHHIAISGVTKALAEKGHHITYVSGLAKGNKINPTHNHKLIHVAGSGKSTRTKAELKGFWENKRGTLDMVTFLMKWGARMCNETMSNPDVQAELNKPGQKYDLVIAELFFFQEAFVGLGHQFNVPVVAINPFGASQFINEHAGNPVNPAWVPSPFLGFSDRMTFFERAINTLFHVVTDLSYTFINLPKQQEIVDRYWPGAPPVDDMLRSNLALTVINNHFTLVYPMPMAPNVVEIGGIHIPQKRNPLPKDLQEFLDSAKEGVLYFSMGSNLKVQYMPEDKKDAILGGLGALKERVLLKWDGEVPKGLPPNIRTIEWAPQSDLLAHPNIRAFWTHGGLLSTQESVYFGVPLLGMPMFGDQQFNMMLAERKGFCVKLDFETMTRASVDAALDEILHNPKYKKAASKLSGIFRSKAVQPAEAAVFSIEHVLEHGADHLKPSNVFMPLYQLLLLDVILAGAAVVLLPLLLLWACCRALCGGKKAASSPSKRKKNN
ncbi:UDP-glycosyltransferase UGT5 [Frankliniella fusca]|uniref:UDP-glycosyltransferase UGT5 n=1 Tax=Frankliniella fusca TaxID=407009 RepID=A0AAE1LQB6_9NEOP|nr:UDP-glycosyltransferase UGT5 [Frankliniella fusca]